MSNNQNVKILNPTIYKYYISYQLSAISFKPFAESRKLIADG